MNEIQRLLSGEHPFTGAVTGDGGAFRPVDFFRLCRPFWNKPCDGLSALGNDNFLASPDAGEEAGVMVSQLADCGGLHVATLM